MSSAPSTITRLLRQWQAGDATALEKLSPLVYPELRRIAHRYAGTRREIQPTELLHDAFIRLMGASNIDWQNRMQFYGVAATLMRLALVDLVRRQKAKKRWSTQIRITLSERHELKVKEQ